MRIESFSSQALAYGASSPILNPVNQGQKNVNIYLGKPVRAAARFIFGITAVTIIPTIGTFYHLTKTIQCTIAYGSMDTAHERSKAWKHLKAGFVDGFIATTHILALGVIPAVLANYVPQELARINRFSNPNDLGSLIALTLTGGYLISGLADATVYSLVGCASIAGAAALIKPILFTVFPHIYKAKIDQ